LGPQQSSPWPEVRRRTRHCRLARPPPGPFLAFLHGRHSYHRSMFSWPRPLRLFAWRARSPAEPSRVIIGSTGSGKSEGELVDLVRLADRRDCAVVLLDGHGPLAFAAAGHWAARGHETRLVYEPLHAVDRVLAWDMVPKSSASNPSRRRLEDAE